MPPKPINPPQIAPPASAYNHGFLTEGVRDLLTLSGQLGEAPDGTCRAGAEAQSRQAWENVFAILAEAGMGPEHVVKVTSYIVGQENIAAYVAVHKELHGDRLPPWTLVCVPALGKPDYLVEIDVLAAR
ncbi:RidA family protein [Pacificispira sp.]|uniref:RidA family protein n=1 Tax=Pacificispira sp. TaxID=2888761 RepID=UPI003BA8F247